MHNLTPTAARDYLATLLPAGHPTPDDSTATDITATVAWNAITEPGDPLAHIALSHGASTALAILTDGDATDWHRDLTGQEAPTLDTMREAHERWLHRAATLNLVRILDTAATGGQTLITRHGPAWPTQLDDLGTTAPLALWARGDVQRLHPADPATLVAIVGSRAASGYGEHITMESARHLADHGHTTVSGGAYGIDATNHRATLMAGGSTIAVLASALDHLYPAGNHDLLARIPDSGVLLSETPNGHTPTRHRFLARGRIIAALTRATVVIEASARSGSLHIAQHAHALGRPVGAVPGPITSGASTGCHTLIRDGIATLIGDTHDMTALLEPR